MTDEKNIRRTYRLCPCNAMDIEGIQTWLEDLAAEGLMLESDGIFCGFWSFLRAAPQKAQYRLEVVRHKFGEDSDTPQEEMLEAAEAMGWEYVGRYKFFYIYRSVDPHVRPFHTDPAVHALTVKALKKQQCTELILDALYVILIFFLRRSRFGLLFRDAVVLGPLYALSCVGFFTCLVLTPLVHVFYLRHYEKKLKNGESLDAQKPWKNGTSGRLLAKAVVPVLAAVWLCTMFSGWVRSTENVPLESFHTDAPFAAIEEVYPEGEVTSRTDMGDYNTTLTWSNLISKNTEWKEAGHITVDGRQYHFILRVTCHETAAPWIARQAAQDYYTADATRYNGKRFEAMEAPEVEADDIWVYSSYGIRYVLLRQGSTVIHATVSIDEGQSADHWQQWLHATLQKMNG